MLYPDQPGKIEAPDATQNWAQLEAKSGTMEDELCHQWAEEHRRWQIKSRPFAALVFAAWLAVLGGVLWLVSSPLRTGTDTAPAPAESQALVEPR